MLHFLDIRWRAEVSGRFGYVNTFPIFFSKTKKMGFLNGFEIFDIASLLYLVFTSLREGLPQDAE